jgi:hypothetical protein
MDKESEQRPTPDSDTVRETLSDRDKEIKEAAKEEFEDDPSRNPDDENLKGIKGA